MNERDLLRGLFPRNKRWAERYGRQMGYWNGSGRILYSDLNADPRNFCDQAMSRSPDEQWRIIELLSKFVPQESLQEGAVKPGLVLGSVLWQHTFNTEVVIVNGQIVTAENARALFFDCGSRNGSSITPQTMEEALEYFFSQLSELPVSEGIERLRRDVDWQNGLAQLIKTQLYSPIKFYQDARELLSKHQANFSQVVINSTQLHDMLERSK